MSLRSKLIRIHWLLAEQFGFNLLRALHSMRGVPRYLRDLRRFRKSYRGPLSYVPCLYDWYEEGGVTRSEYFWQDLLVARKIFEASPQKHVDIGSRVDGFIAHVASFREVEVLDVRPITSKVPGVSFKQADLMHPVVHLREYCDSLSCLHALEHFGLGRYGDPVDPDGWRQGLFNMAMILKPGGQFYLSVPVGRGRVEFNANRIFEPLALLQAARQCGLTPVALTVVRNGQDAEEVPVTEHTLADLRQLPYALGIFTLTKNPVSTSPLVAGTA